MRQHRYALALIVLATALGAGPRAQEQPSANASAPLQVQVVISRYLGDKKVGSLPYSLSVNADNNKTSLRIGANVPVATTTFPPAARGEKPATPLTSYSYQQIGTNIDCTATPSGGNQYRLRLEIEDSSLYPDDTRAPKGVPAFRSFKLSNTLLLRDGQSTQLTSAADKVSGEILKVDVMLTVLK